MPSPAVRWRVSGARVATPLATVTLVVSLVVSPVVSLVTARPATAAGAMPTWWLRPPVPGPPVRGFEVPAGRFGPGHRGIDFAAPAGTPVTAPAAGRVHFAGRVGGTRWVTVEPVPGVLASVGPLAQVTVRAGQHLGARTIVGTAGTDATHDGAVHLGLRVDGEYADPLPHLARARPPRLVPLTGPLARPTVTVPPGPSPDARPVAPTSAVWGGLWVVWQRLVAATDARVSPWDRTRGPP